MGFLPEEFAADVEPIADGAMEVEDSEKAAEAIMDGAVEESPEVQKGDGAAATADDFYRGWVRVTAEGEILFDDDEDFEMITI